MASDYLIAFPGLTSHTMAQLTSHDGSSVSSTSTEFLRGGALLVAHTTSVVGNTGLHCFPSEFGICDIGCPRIKVCQVLNTHSCGQSPSETTLINRGQNDTFKESRYSTRTPATGVLWVVVIGARSRCRVACTDVGILDSIQASQPRGPRFGFRPDHIVVRGGRPPFRPFRPFRPCAKDKKAYRWF